MVEASFADQRAMQTVPVEPPIVSSTLKMVILETTEAQHPDDRDYTAVSELAVIGTESAAQAEPASPALAQATPTSPPAAASLVPASWRYAFPVQPVAAARYTPCHHDYPASDIHAPLGTDVVAVTDGVVDWVSTDDQWSGGEDDPAARGGVAVAIVGNDGVRYYGSHLSSVEDGIAPGVRVAAGQLLGKVGQSGNAASSAPHLHFGISRPTSPDDWETRRGAIDPFPYLEAWRRGENVTPDLGRTGGGVC
jgi:murein DD-endopeptidase MepM/ murein hydrolase activator NlpD